MRVTIRKSSSGLLSERKADHRAIAAAGSLFVFLLIIKLVLLCWYLFARKVNPLADVPVGRRWLVIGADALLCLAVAGVFFGLYRLSRLHRMLRVPVGRVLPALTYGFLVFFCTASFQITRIYGAPLDIEKIRSGDDLMVMRDSIWAYMGTTPLVLMAIGFASYPLMGPWVARRLARRRWLRSRLGLWSALAGVCLALGGLQYFQLKRIDTLGVKDNAVVYFVRHYAPAFRPIDTPKLLAELNQKINGQAGLIVHSRSLAGAEEDVARDFDYSGALGRDFNVIAIQLESTGAVHFDRACAPNLFTLVDHGVSFKRHLTTMTETSRATYSIYYSDYMPDLGTAPSLVYGRPMPQRSLPELLYQAGYRTGLFHSGFLDYLDIRFLFQDKGLEVAVGAREMLDGGAKLASTSGVAEEDTVGEMIAWIGKHKAEKFFAAYLTQTPHHPYRSFIDDKPFKGDGWLDRYRNSIYYTDHCIGRLIEYLKEQGLFEKTIFVIYGDHGETVATYPVGHGINASAEEMTTPFIVSNPVLFPTPLESRLCTSHLDIAPTAGHLLALDAPAEWLGRDLLAERVPLRLQFVTISHAHKTGILDNGTLYVVGASGESSDLYDLTAGSLTAVPANDPRRELIPAYRSRIDLFKTWSVQHHLQRAVDKKL